MSTVQGSGLRGGGDLSVTRVLTLDPEWVAIRRALVLVFIAGLTLGIELGALAYCAAGSIRGG